MAFVAVGIETTYNLSTLLKIGLWQKVVTFRTFNKNTPLPPALPANDYCFHIDSLLSQPRLPSPLGRRS